MRYKSILFGIIQILFCLPAICQTFPSDTAAYYIVSAVGNKYLTVKDANVESGARLEIRGFTGSDAMHPSANQVWTLQEFGNKHHYFIKSRQGKVIDLKDGITENRAIVQMWGFGGYTNHRWQLTDAGGGFFYITNWTSGKVMEVSGGVNENGRPVWSFQKNSTNAQKWKFLKTTEVLKDELLTGEPTVCENKYIFDGPQDIELNTAGVKYCPQKEDEWESVVKQQLGISAKNRTNHYIGWSAAGVDGALGVLAGRNWYPIADMKKVHIGKLCEIGYFDAKEETDIGEGKWFAHDQEKDFNLHVLPSSSFSYQIEKSIVRYNPNLKFGGGLNIDCKDNWVKCGSTLVMEGEITPDDEFIANPNNPWLGIKNLTGTSSLFLNQNVGMYGPWVNEEVHCNHPEIHPVEMLWSETADPNVKYLCLFQDDSDRFGYYSNFPDYEDASDKVEAKKKIHPWAATPLSGQFFIAFELNLNVPLNKKQKISYTIDVQTSKEVVTTMPEAKIPAREYGGRTNVIKDNGVEILRVTENQENANDVAIRFELFKNKEGNKILGYMVISAAVSRNLDGKEGYMVIRLDKTVTDLNRATNDIETKNIQQSPQE